MDRSVEEEKEGNYLREGGKVTQPNKKGKRGSATCYA